MISRFIRIVPTLVACCVLSVVFSTHAEASISWKGVDWDIFGSGTANVNGAGELELTPTGTAAFGLHVNRLPAVTGPGVSSVNQFGTPSINFSYVENTGYKIEGLINDETLPEQPFIGAGSLFGASQVINAKWGIPPTRPDHYALFAGTAADGVTHDVTLGKDATGMLYYTFDSTSGQDDNIKNGVGDFDFNDIYLRVRGNGGANGSGGDTIVFTDFGFGDDFVPANSAIPEPTAFLTWACLGLCGTAATRRRRS